MLQPLFDEIWKLDPNATNDLAHPLAINRLIDGWMSAYLDGRTPEWQLSDKGIDLVWLFISKKYNEIKLPGLSDHYLARLHATTFFKYVIDWIEGKLLDPFNEYEQNLKYVGLFAHGGTVSGFMAAIDHDIWTGPKLGADLTVELFWDRSNDVYVNFKYNNETVNVGGICIEGDCPVEKFLTYLKSWLVKGDVGQICWMES